MLAGSQVSLKYDIDLSLTQIPENLIFYSDAGMTKALYKENGVIHLDGYFGASDTNKTATQNLYWQWKLETGITQAEIDANDLLDSAWMGDNIILGVQATGRQVMDSPQEQYEVTFDLNGGTLANHGDSTQITKDVNYGETYGTLPEPTREGYRFVGWNGKNLINVDAPYSIPRDTSSSNQTRRYYRINTKVLGNHYDNYYRPNTIIEAAVSDSKLTVAGSYDYGVGYVVEVQPNTNYTFSCNASSEGTPAVGITSYTSDWTKIGYILSEEYTINRTFLTSNSTKYIIINFYTCYSNTAPSTFSNIQLEKGNVGTEYESYRVVSEENYVDEEHNQTLTAIWEPNP